MLLDGIFSNLVSNAGEFVGDHVVHENAERWSHISNLNSSNVLIL